MAGQVVSTYLINIIELHFSIVIQNKIVLFSYKGAVSLSVYLFLSIFLKNANRAINNLNFLLVKYYLIYI